MSKCYITFSAFTGLLEEIKKREIDLCAEFLKSNNHGICDLGNCKYISLKAFSELLSHATNLSQEDFLAWSVGSTFKPSFLGELGEIITRAHTLGESLAFCCQYFRLVKTWSFLDLEIQDDLAVLKYKVLDNEYWPREYDAEFTLSFLLSLIDFYVDQKIYINSINFETAPRPIENFITQHYRSDVVFNSVSNQIVFPASYLDCQLATRFSDNHNKLILKHLSSDLDLFLKEQSFSELVRYEIFKLIDQQMIDQKTISEVLNMSQRSLRRNLFVEGATFKEQVEYCRSTQAKNALNHTSLPFSEIAFRLGYSDQSAFSRACIRWFNMSPAAVRLRCKNVTN